MLNVGDELAHRLQAAGYLLQLSRVAGGEERADLLHLAEGGGQLAYLTRGDTPDDGLRCHALEVPDTDEELAGRATQVGRTYEIRDDRLSAVDLGEVNEGEGKPVAEQASTHSCLGVVDDVE